MARSRAVVLASFTFYMGFTFVPYTLCPLMALCPVDIRYHYNSSLGCLEGVKDGGYSYPELERAIDSSLVMASAFLPKQLMIAWRCNDSSIWFEGL